MFNLQIAYFINSGEYALTSVSYYRIIDDLDKLGISAEIIPHNITSYPPPGFMTIVFNSEEDMNLFKMSVDIQPIYYTMNKQDKIENHYEYVATK